MNEETNFDGSVIVVKPTSFGSYEKLRNQFGQFHVAVNLSEDDTPKYSISTIKCISDIINPYEDLEGYLQSAHQPHIRFIISNTTEKGISCGQLQDIRPDSTPEGFPEKVTMWLYERFKWFKGDSDKGCVIIPLELVESNGLELKRCIIECATYWEFPTSFINWIINHNYFVNTLVDRIVPGFPHDHKEIVWSQIGWKDEMIACAEPYHYWVLDQKELIDSEIPFKETKLNVNLVDDVSIHRSIKVRILNGAHTAMIPFGIMAGLELVHEAMSLESINRFTRKLILEEVVPLINAPKDELLDFAYHVFERFENIHIKHKLLDISLHSIFKFNVRLLPTIREYLKKFDRLPSLTVAAFAGLVKLYCDQGGMQEILIKDDHTKIRAFHQLYASAKDTYVFSHEILSDAELWGDNLNQIPGLTKQLARGLDDLNSMEIAEFLESVTA